MISNQFVELKGSVFKKFDKNNLFQVSCSDVRERFHLFVLLFIVVLQTMKEYSWKEGKTIFIQIIFFLLIIYLFCFRTILDSTPGLFDRVSFRSFCRLDQARLYQQI